MDFSNSNASLFDAIVVLAEHLRLLARNGGIQIDPPASLLANRYLHGFKPARLDQINDVRLG